MPRPSIVLLGHTGVGKSASGNTILGRDAFESRRSFKSVTTNIHEETETVFGKEISVIDTPGILSDASEMKIKTFCQEQLDSSSTLFLVVVKIDRFTEESQEAVEAAIRVIEPHGLERGYLLFAGVDRLDGDLDEFINEEDDSPLQSIIERFEGRYLGFNNKHGGPEQVKDLLKTSGLLSTEPGRLKRRKIVLFGLSGAGKSSSGNTILGSQKFSPNCGFGPGTHSCVTKSAIVEGQEITVIDTPGVNDSSRSPQEVTEDIFEALEGEDIHAFVIVIKIDRASKADHGLLQYFPTMFGTDALNSTMVLFTYGDNLKGEPMDEKIKASRVVTEMIELCSRRYCVFNNTQSRNRQQVRMFLHIVDEMVQNNGVQHCNTRRFMPHPRGDVGRGPFDSESFDSESSGEGSFTMRSYRFCVSVRDFFVCLIQIIRDYLSRSRSRNTGYMALS